MHWFMRLHSEVESSLEPASQLAGRFLLFLHGEDMHRGASLSSEFNGLVQTFGAGAAHLFTEVAIGGSFPEPQQHSEGRFQAAASLFLKRSCLHSRRTSFLPRSVR